MLNRPGDAMSRSNSSSVSPTAEAHLSQQSSRNFLESHNQALLAANVIAVRQEEGEE